ncbi:NADH:flavin oxidoreductase [Gordonia sp. (in: high G+C Gram-positive bacteria)]|uniref:oxidoreductase n=1 Tax=Gordonia sp. (in: high G+C Gram-positive bacteria) TaxID=84139 RepID=UPI003C774D63
MTDTLLAAPLHLPCGQILPNRLAKAAMSEQLANRDGTPSDRLRRLYAVWARSGAGLLLSGNIMVDRDAMTEPGNVILDDARGRDALTAWTAAATETGSRFWAQINHPGRVAVTPFNKRPVAPSARRESVPGYNLRKPRELSAADVTALIGRFARTAELAVDAGFDGVQVHAAHGYLLSQFLSPLANRRTDEWGGDETRRRRLLLEVIAAVRASVGPDVAVSVKLNSNDFVHGGFVPEEALDVALALAEAGVDLLEISGGGYAQPAMTGVARGQEDSGEGYFLDFARRVRVKSAVPIMLTGGLRSPEAMESILAEGAVDVIGIGRPFTFVPDYGMQLLGGRCPTLPPAPRKLGYRPVDGYFELAWHNDQLHRIAGGRTPERRPGPLTLARAMSRISVAAAKQAAVPR